MRAGELQTLQTCHWKRWLPSISWNMFLNSNRYLLRFVNYQHIQIQLDRWMYGQKMEPHQLGNTATPCNCTNHSMGRSQNRMSHLAPPLRCRHTRGQCFFSARLSKICRPKISQQIPDYLDFFGCHSLFFCCFLPEWYGSSCPHPNFEIISHVRHASRSNPEVTYLVANYPRIV